MKYFSWLWNNSCGIRWNTVVRIVTGIVQVMLGLLMVWLSKRFIDETIRTGTADDVLRMVELLVLTVVGGVVLRQVGYWLKTSANVRSRTLCDCVSSAGCFTDSCSRATNCTQATCPHDWPRTLSR